KDIATHFSVSVDEVRRWNEIDPSARLHDGMTLQIFAPKSADLSRVVALREDSVRVLAVGSEEFFTYWEERRGRRRVVVAARPGDTLETVGKRYGITAGSMERINHKNRSAVLTAGDQVVLYLAAGAHVDKSGAPAIAAPDSDGPFALPAAV